jgi:hypothetical protein
MLQVVLLFAVIINSDGRAQPRCSCGCLAGTRLVSSQERGHCMRTVSRFAISGVGGWEEQTLPHRMWQHITTKAMSVCCSLAALECSATGHAFGALHHCRVLVLVRQI